MNLLQSVVELQRGRKPTTADIELHKFYRKLNKPTTQLCAASGWTGGEALLQRLRTAPSVFALSQELNDALLFGSWLEEDQGQGRQDRRGETGRVARQSPRRSPMNRWTVEVVITIHELEDTIQVTPQGPVRGQLVRGKTTFACGAEALGTNPGAAVAAAMSKAGNFLHKLQTPDLNEKES